MMEKCKHIPRVEGSSLIELPIDMMVYPPRKYFECSCCGKVFNYIYENGSFKLSKEEEGNADVSGNIQQA